MARWRCPACDREFGRARQKHVCVPGCTVEEVFAGHPPAYRAIYDALVRDLGPVHEDAVSVGVLLKADRSFAEVRPKARSLELSIWLTRQVSHPLLARSVPGGGGRYWHVFKLTDPAQVDDLLCAWLAEASDG